MKQIIRLLLKKYFVDASLLTKDITVAGRGAHQIIRIATRRSAEAWGLIDENLEPSDEKAGELVEKVRIDIAEQLFLLAQEAVRKKGLDHSILKIDPKSYFGRTDIKWNRERKVMYCIQVFLEIGVLNTDDIETSADIFDEELTYLGSRKLAQKTAYEEQIDEVQDEMRG